MELDERIFALEAYNLNREVQNEISVDRDDPFINEARVLNESYNNEVALLELLMEPLEEGFSFKGMIESIKKFIHKIFTAIVNFIRERIIQFKLKKYNKDVDYIVEQLRKAMYKAPNPEYLERYGKETFAWYNFNYNAVRSLGNIPFILFSGRIGDGSKYKEYDKYNTEEEVINSMLYGKILTGAGEVKPNKLTPVIMYYYKSLLDACGWEYDKDNGYYQTTEARHADIRKILQLKDILNDSMKAIIQHELRFKSYEKEMLIFFGNEARVKQFCAWHGGTPEKVNMVVRGYLKAALIKITGAIQAIEEINKLVNGAIKKVQLIYFGEYLTGSKDTDRQHRWHDYSVNTVSMNSISDKTARQFAGVNFNPFKHEAAMINEDLKKEEY